MKFIEDHKVLWKSWFWITEQFVPKLHNLSTVWTWGALFFLSASFSFSAILFLVTLASSSASSSASSTSSASSASTSSSGSCCFLPRLAGAIVKKCIWKKNYL